MSGWYAMKRGWLDHEALAPVGQWSRAEAWVFLVEAAAIKPTVIDIAGRPYTVPRGACCFSLRFLATKWKWSVKAVTSFLNVLERHGVVKVHVAKTATGTATRRTQVTLCNYDKYQFPGNKTETRGKQEGNKEEQETNNNTSDANASEGADAPQGAVIEMSLIHSALWTTGKQFLTSRGVKNPGSMIGRWLKEYQDPLRIISALGAAQTSGTHDPIPYVQAFLRGQKESAPDLDAIFANLAMEAK